MDIAAKQDHIFDVHLRSGRWRVDISNIDGAGVYSGPGAHGRLKFLGKVLIDAFEIPTPALHLLLANGYTVG
jgi:hypothetical protein